MSIEFPRILFTRNCDPVILLLHLTSPLSQILLVSIVLSRSYEEIGICAHYCIIKEINGR